MKTITGLKSSISFAMETRFKAANGKKCLRSWKLEEVGMCHCLFRSLMTSAIEQQKKIKDHKIMVENLKRGDNVITSGGIVGTVERIIDNEKIAA